jgi:hypothetical protein
LRKFVILGGLTGGGINISVLPYDITIIEIRIYLRCSLIFGITESYIAQETNNNFKKFINFLPQWKSRIKYEVKYCNVSTNYKHISCFNYLAYANFKRSIKYKHFLFSTLLDWLYDAKPPKFVDYVM